MPAPHTDRLALSVVEAAEAINVSRARLYQLLSDGTVPSIKLGRRRLIRREALVEFLVGLEGRAGDAAYLRSDTARLLSVSRPHVDNMVCAGGINVVDIGVEA